MNFWPLGFYILRAFFYFIGFSVRFNLTFLEKFGIIYMYIEKTGQIN
jgi:hypothetical protein